MFNKKIALLLAVSLSSIHAIETHSELSYVKTSGNTDTTSFAAKLKASEKINESVSVDGSVDILYGKTGNTETANKFNIEANYNHNISGDLFAYVGVSYLDDKFSGYDYRMSVGPGFGYKVLHSDLHKLDVKAGIDYASDKLDNGTTQDYAMGRVKGNYTYMINKSVAFKQLLGYSNSFEDSDVYFINSETSIAVKMTEKLSLGVSYKVDYQNYLPSVGIDHTDTAFMTSLIVDF